jgi:hypothetical protein
MVHGSLYQCQYHAWSGIISGYQRPGLSELFDCRDTYSAGGQFGKNELVCRDVERPAMAGAAEALR